MREKEKTYKITAKGFLAAQLIDKGLEIEDAENIWDNLAEFVKEQAVANGLKGGTPCLIFHEGGVCIAAERSQ